MLIKNAYQTCFLSSLMVGGEDGTGRVESDRSSTRNLEMFIDS